MRTKTRTLLTAAMITVGVAGSGGVAQAEFGVSPSNFNLGLAAGEPSMDAHQAGGHPDVKVGFKVNMIDPSVPFPVPDGTIRNLDLDLPTGLVANPTIVPECTMGRTSDLVNPCPRESAVGSIEYSAANPGFNSTYDGFTRLYRVTTQPGEAAAFGAYVKLFPVRLAATVGPDGGYRIKTTIEGLTEAQPLKLSNVTLWGVPSDHQGPGAISDSFGNKLYGGPLTPAPASRTPFVSAPGRCDTDPLQATLTLTSWQTGKPIAPVTAETSGLTDCDQLPWDPTLDVQPTNPNAGQPSGYRVDLNVPQSNEATTLATPNLKNAVVSLPAGTAISPPAADGLDACTDAQLAITSDADETCSDASKIGTVAIDTPLLDEQVKGSLYVGEQLSNDPESGEMYRMFLTAKADGVKVKLRGAIKADRKTGQLTASFLDNPQVPFSKFSLTFTNSDRSVLANPATCGTYETKGTLSSWGGQTKDVSSSFVIDQGCPTGAFNPTFTAGTVGAFAGAFSPFTTTISRTDSEQDLSRISMTLPSGLLGALGSVPICAEAQAAAGTCSPEQQLGTTTVAAGTGARPYYLDGKVFLAGPYKGAPFSLSIVVNAKAGPFDLGLVVVRAPLQVNANNANAAVVSDPLPTIVGGVPIHYRTVNVKLDRPGFMFNATSCKPMSISSSLESTSGAIATPAVPYQAQGCDKLKLDPKLDLQFTGPSSELISKNSKPSHPGVKASMSWAFGDSNLKKVTVVLPLSVALAADNAQGLCKPEQAAARNCPEASIVGKATANTQALHEPLTGPIYFVEGTRKTASGATAKTLPKLWLKLQGEGVPLDLWADSDVDPKTQQLTTTFANIPDAPIRGFQMEIDPGKYGILATTTNVCAADKKSVVTYEGQNGGTRRNNVAFTTPTCAPQISSAKVVGNKVSVRVAGINGGRLTLSGKGVKSTRRTIKNAAAATVSASLSKSTRAAIRGGRTVKLRLAVKYAPKQGKAVTIRKVVTVKGKSTKK